MPVVLEVTVEWNAKAAIAALAKIAAQVKASLPAVVAEGSEVIQTNARAELAKRPPSRWDVPGRVPGRLAASIRTFTPYPSGVNEWSARTAPTVIYGRLQELGGHIYPVRAAYLHWYANGTEFFRKHVYVPGRPYLEPGLQVSLPQLYEVAEKTWGEALVA